MLLFPSLQQCESDNSIYQEVLDHRTSPSGGLQYLIRWNENKYIYDSWEYSFDVTCSKLIMEHQKKFQANGDVSPPYQPKFSIDGKKRFSVETQSMHMYLVALDKMERCFLKLYIQCRIRFHWAQQFYLWMK
jgi:hypothetical protein